MRLDYHLYPALQALSRDETIIVDQVTLRHEFLLEPIEIRSCVVHKLDAPIRPGDFYVCECNTGPKLLVCKEIKQHYWVTPTDMFMHSCDIMGCIRVEILEEIGRRKVGPNDGLST